MAKTLRVRTRTGWVTKPAADEPENRLIAEEVDDNFLALEDQITGINTFEVGYSLLVAKDLSMPGWLPMDGEEYANTTYPTLGALLGGVYTFDSAVSGTPTLAGTGIKADLSPDGSVVAIGHSQTPFLTLLNTSDWSVVAGTPTLPNTGRTVRYNKDGSQLAVGFTSTPYFQVYNTSDWSLVSGTPTIAGTVYIVAYSPDHRYLAIGHDVSPYVTIVRTSDWSEVSGLPTFTGIVRGIEFSHSGEYLFVGQSGGTDNFRVLRTSDWTFVTTGITSISTAYSLTVSSDDRYVAIGHSSGSPSLSIISVPNWSVAEGPSGLALNLQGMRFSKTNKYLAIAQNGSNSLAVLDMDTQTLLSGVHVPAGTLGYDVQFVNDEANLVMLTSTSPYVEVVDVMSDTSFAVPDMPAPRYDMEWRVKAE